MVWGRGFQGKSCRHHSAIHDCGHVLSMLLAREWDYRAQAAIARLTKNAAFRYKAYIEQIDYATNRGWIATRWNVLPPLILCIRHKTFSLPVLQEQEKVIEHKW